MKSYGKRWSVILGALFACLAPAASSDAAIVLTEGFETDSPGTYLAPLSVGAFEIVSGSVDIFAASGTPCATAGGASQCADLDGGFEAPSGSGITGATLRVALAPGTYDVTFDLAGSQVDAVATKTFVSLGGTILEISKTAIEPFTGFSLFGTATAADPYLVFFQESNFGAGNLLDNVVVADRAVPEPTALLLLTTGLAALAAHRRWRRPIAPSRQQLRDGSPVRA